MTFIDPYRKWCTYPLPYAEHFSSKEYAEWVLREQDMQQADQQLQERLLEAEIRLRNAQAHRLELENAQMGRCAPSKPTEMRFGKDLS